MNPIKEFSPSPAQPRCAIGLDVGGTKMLGCLVSADGIVHAEVRKPTLAARGADAVASDALELATQLHAAAMGIGFRQPAGLGIGICELVDVDGRVASECTIAWRDARFLDPFSRLLPLIVEADSRAAAFAEGRCGAGKAFPIFLYVTVGTGIGCSLVVHGEPFRGARGFTGTMATGPLTTLCDACGTLQTSHLEQIASGAALARRYGELQRRGAPPSPDDRAAQHDDAPALSAEAVLRAIDQGDAAARRVVETGAHCLGSMIGQLVNVLDPHGVVVGGGLGSAPGLYWETLQNATRTHIWADAQRNLPLVQGALGSPATAIGAALLALDKFT